MSLFYTFCIWRIMWINSSKLLLGCVNFFYFKAFVFIFSNYWDLDLVRVGPLLWSGLVHYCGPSWYIVVRVGILWSELAMVRVGGEAIELHWLPMKARIIYRICLLTYKATGRSRKWPVPAKSAGWIHQQQQQTYKAIKFGEPKYLNEYLVPFELETSVTVRHANDRHRFWAKNNP